MSLELLVRMAARRRFGRRAKGRGCRRNAASDEARRFCVAEGSQRGKAAFMNSLERYDREKREKQNAGRRWSPMIIINARLS